MKLFKTTDIGDTRCRAITGSGKRCSRSSIDGAFCRQHLAQYEKSETPIWEHPPGRLDRVPPPPADLDDRGRGLWRQVCQLLLDNDLLTGLCLHDVYDLCWWDGELQRRREDLITQGAYNVYDTDTGRIGHQRNGISAAMTIAQDKINAIREKLWLSLDGQIKLAKHNKDRRPVSGILAKKPTA